MAGCGPRVVKNETAIPAQIEFGFTGQFGKAIGEEIMLTKMRSTASPCPSLTWLMAEVTTPAISPPCIPTISRS
jgi:hypothetical protein